MHRYLTLTLLTLLLAACSESLDTLVKRADSRCPVTIPNVGFLTGVKRDADTVVYECEVANTAIPLQRFAARTALLHTAMLPTLPALFRDDAALGEAVLSHGMYVKVRYKAPGADVSVLFTPADLEGSHTLTPQQETEAQLEIANMLLPRALDSYTTLEHATLQDSTIVLTLAITEPVATLQAAAADLRQHLLESTFSGDDDLYVRLARRHGLNLQYRYHNGGDTMSVTIAAAEMLLP